MLSFAEIIHLAESTKHLSSAQIKRIEELLPTLSSDQLEDLSLKLQSLKDAEGMDEATQAVYMENLKRKYLNSRKEKWEKEEAIDLNEEQQLAENLLINI